jgi:hypothetical protein
VIAKPVGFDIRFSFFMIAEYFQLSKNVLFVKFIDNIREILYILVDLYHTKSREVTAIRQYALQL